MIPFGESFQDTQVQSSLHYADAEVSSLADITSLLRFNQPLIASKVKNDVADYSSSGQLIVLMRYEKIL